MPQVAGYEILGILGRGAMGVVYKARQPGLKRLVALKMILSGEHAGTDELARFRAEAESVARLQHPNIVQIYEVGEYQGRSFFSMEYVEGGTLADRLRGAPQAPEQSAQLIRTLALAMAAAHQHHVIHRDLKPANVLLASGGRQPPVVEEPTEDLRPPLAECVPKISDFGLAKRLDEDASHTQTGAILGSPSYMAREQAEGKSKEVGPLSDVYSLGAVLYEMLTGRPPFRGTTILETLEQVRTREPVPPGQLQPRVPRDLETICLKCLHKDAVRRYAGARELADDLGRFLNGEPILARPVSRTERLTRWCRRNPLLAAVSALAVVLLIAWGSTSSWLAWKLSREKDATEQAHNEAVNNAILARRNEKEAQANEKKATIARDNALRRHDETVHAMIDLGVALQRQLQGEGVPRELGPEAKALSDHMLGTLRQAMLKLSQQMVGDKLTSFGLARAHQSMGDLFKRLGQGEAALREYQRALDLIEEVVRKEADNDLARGNQALMVALIAEKKLELTGNARTAYENFLRSSQIQQDIADHPRSGFYRDRPPDNERLLANYHLQRGRASLLLADPDAGRRSFEQAVRLRRQVAAAAKNTNKEVESQGYLAESCYWLGQACARRGDDKATRAAFDEAAAICEELVGKFPKYHDFKNDLADVYGAYGDALLCLGRPAEARRLYEKALPLVRIAFDKQSDKLEYRMLLARTYHRLGLVEKDAAAARTHFQAALPLREQLRKLDGQNVFYQADLACTLAHCGRTNDAARLADTLRKQIEDNPTLLLQIADCYAQCAAAAPAADRPAYVEKALQVLRTAVTKDFKDTRLLKTDPDLEPIRRQPAYQEIVSRVGES
ncbi:MAG TPA: serine/threonine-protein kinase [Gemmataceae bacterium]